MVTFTPPYQTVVITSIVRETPGVKTFTLTYEDGSEIPYAAGQFITFVFTHHGREERRSFSISSCPATGEPLSITIKRIENGAYSRLLIDRGRVGDRLQTTGVGGLFTMPENNTVYKQVIFFAAGIGITPILSLIKTLLHSEPGKQIVLIYSNRSQEEVVFYNELNLLASKYANSFKVEYLYSTSYDLSRARLSKALVPVLLAEYVLVAKHDLLFYLCGPFTYMRMLILTLEELDFHSDQVRKENFNTNDQQVRKAEPPDKETHMVSLSLNGAEHTFPVQYPDTILSAAQKAGLVLPYSCEVGRCGSCAALCTRGKVWLSYNEVLMDNDLKQGKILTCVGHPVGGDVWIEI